MKVGTVSKVTAGAAALVALIFIGFIAVRQMTVPPVEERVYLSPWEDGTERPQKNSEDLALQTDATQDTENRDNQSQSSTEELEMVDDSLGQPQETDTGQFATEVEFELDADQSFFANISALLDDEGRSAEEVMNIYVEALRSLDAEGLGSLMAGAAKEKFESQMLPVLKGELPQDYIDTFHSVALDMVSPEKAEEMVDYLIQTVKPGVLPVLKQMFGSAEVVSSEHIGDELHFQVRISSPEIPGTSKLGIPEMPKMPDQLNKIRKENGVWRIYYSQ